jgi:hypothetical protein
VARCSCGALTIPASGEPVEVYACSCLDCQRATGGAFSYAALFPESAVSVSGETKQYRHRGDSGRFIHNFFCPACGTGGMFRGEGLPGVVGVPVGSFADPSFAKPSKLFWASRKHHWLEFGDAIPVIDTQ